MRLLHLFYLVISPEHAVAAKIQFKAGPEALFQKKQACMAFDRV